MLPRSLRDSASAAISSGDLGLGGSAGVVGVGSGALVVGDGDVDSGGGVEVVVVVGSVSMGVSSLSVCLGSLNKVQQKGGDRCKPECEGRKSNVDVSDQKTTRLLDEIDKHENILARECVIITWKSYHPRPCRSLKL